MVSGVVDEIRHFYDRGDYESAQSRAQQLLLRSRPSRHKTEGAFLLAIRVAALVHLRRFKEASDILSSSAFGEDALHVPGASLREFQVFTQAYISWATNDGADAALQDLTQLSSGNRSYLTQLKAQLCYRLGDYINAAKLYRSMLTEKRELLSRHKEHAKSKDSVTRAWAFMSRQATNASIDDSLLSPTEVRDLQQNIYELATNLMACLVLAGEAGEALTVKYDTHAGYEIEYNAGCAAIADKSWILAKASVQEAERLLRADMVDDDEEDMASELVPILVQQAFLSHVSGSVIEAEQQLSRILKGRVGDQASLAVAANNAAVAKAQLALERYSDSSDTSEKRAGIETAVNSEVGSSNHRRTQVAEKAVKERNAALFDALKRMKTTLGQEVERKLTAQQRQAMGRNRANLLVQMGRFEACRQELDKVKVMRQADPLTPLIEAALFAKQMSAKDADSFLTSTQPCDSETMSAARAKLAAESGNALFASQLLERCFPGRAAALATAAAILKDSDMHFDAEELLRRSIEEHPELQLSARHALAAILIQAGKHSEAAVIVREILAVDQNNEVATCYLVIASSHFDVDLAEELVKSQPISGLSSEANADYLESLPPPSRRNVYRSDYRKDPLKENGRLSASTAGEVEARKSNQKISSSAKAQVQRQGKRKRKKNKKLPSDYDPAIPPDPERWLPKTLRSSYKKRKKVRDSGFKGSQGADAASADAAQIRNSERSAARAVDNSADLFPGGTATLPKGAKNKKKSRRR